MKYHIIALDLDGTLTNSKKEISPATRHALIRLQEEGTHVVIATGRPPYGIRPIAETLEFPRFGSYILSYNGGCIYNAATNKILYEQTLDSDYISLIYHEIKDSNLNLIAYEGDKIISAFEPNHATHRSAQNNKMTIQQVDNFVHHFNKPLHKMMVVGPIELINPMLEFLKHKYGKELGFCTSHPDFIEITPPNVDKGAALELLLHHLSLSKEELICCGDGSNDITMLQYAGLGVAMANAHADVQAIADFVTASNDDEGVLRVIETYL